MKVMLIGKATKETEAGQMPTNEAMVAMHNYNEELRKAGVLLDLVGLTPTSRGVRVRYSGSRTSTCRARPRSARSGSAKSSARPSRGAAP